MKTPEEIYYEFIGEGQQGIDFTKKDVIEAMQVYHAQSEEECEWEILDEHISEEPLAYPSCDMPNYRLFNDTWIYCPFCGRKIKRAPQGGGE